MSDMMPKYLLNQSVHARWCHNMSNAWHCMPVIKVQCTSENILACVTEDNA